MIPAFYYTAAAITFVLLCLSLAANDWPAAALCVYVALIQVCNGIYYQHTNKAKGKKEK